MLGMPLWKKLGIVFLAALFVVGGILGAVNGSYLLGGLLATFFGAIGIIVLFAPRTSLVVDGEGISPKTTLWSRELVKIPWSQIKNISIATVSIPTVGGIQKQRYLAIYLHDPDYLQRSGIEEIGKAIDELVGNKYADDGGTAQVYIPATRLPGFSLEKTVAEIKAMHPAASGDSAAQLISGGTR